MSLSHRRVYGKLLGLTFVGLMLTSVLLFAVNIERVFAPSYLTLKWVRGLGDNGRTDVGPLAADLNNDGKMEIVVTGGTMDYSGNQGTVRALNGSTGEILWTYTGYGITPHTPVEIANLDNVGALEIVVPNINAPMALRGDTGAIYWQRSDVPSGNLYSAVQDVNGDGYPEIFINRHKGMDFSYDHATMLTYDGTVLRQAWAWHSCWGGFSVGDANFDGRFELYQGDRSSDYSGSADNYKTGGNGIRALDALTLTPLWSNPDILSSSQTPILADVDKDGILDVIVFMQTNSGPVVLNSADGSVLTTGGKVRKGASGMRSHSQATVYDVDGDGNLEMIVADFSPAYIWDLYDWKLDATILPSNGQAITEPPKVGDVTGDGVMDLIAATEDGQNIFVYSYNQVTKNYDEVDHVTGTHGANTFSLVQDIDGDNLNELVVTSLSGEVYAYDTPAPAPNPKVRSTTPFYSEYRRGAAEYVPPLNNSVVRPALSDEQPPKGALNQILNPNLSVSASDFQGHSMNIVFGTNVSGTWVGIPGGTYIDVPNNVYGVTPANMGSYGTKYYWSVNATDRVTQKWTYNVYSFTTLSNPPTQDNPLLVSSLGNNRTKEDLTSHNQTTADPNGDKVTNIYDWNVNGDSLTNLLLPFDTRTESGKRTLLTDGFESNFNNWDGNAATDWGRDTNQEHSGSYSAHADLNADYLTSDDLDTSTADSITVSFWYLDSGIDADDNVYLQFWDGSAYQNMFEIGTNGAEGVWHQYSLWWRTLFQYQIPNFRVRFVATSVDSGEDLWIDDVSITVGGAPAKDYSDQSNDGAVHGATWTSEGVVGGAYDFKGNDYIRITENGNSLGGDGSWSQLSAEFWVKATADTSTYPLIMKHDRYNYSTSGAQPYGIGYRITFRATSTSNIVTWYVYTPTQNALSYTIPTGPRNWHHIVSTYKSGTGLKLYVDGVQVGSLAAIGNINATANGPLNIGWEGSGHFVGMLDEVRIYPRALSPFQVSKRYDETKNGLSTNSTIAWQEAGVGDTWKCQVTPNDGFGDGLSTFSNTLTILDGPNDPPTAQNLQITPSLPLSSANLVASYNYSDTDGDSEWGTETRWYQNDILQPLLNDSQTVPSSFTTKGEVWRFAVRPKDGVSFGSVQNSPSVTILNSPPNFTEVYITPEPAFDTSTLTANPYGWVDNDNDPEVYLYQWQIFSGAVWQNIGGEVSKTLSPDHFSRGDAIRVNCTAYDGQETGTSRLGTTSIVNSDPPTQGTPVLVSDQDGNLVSSNQTTYDPEGDRVTNIYNWIRNGNSTANLLMPFDTNTSHAVKDYSGYGNNGTVSGATWTTQGVVGGAFSFDGNDIITIPDSPSLVGNATWDQISIEFWIKLREPRNGTRIIAKKPASGSTGSYIVGFQTSGSPSNTLFFGITNPDGFQDQWNDATTVLGVGSWYHVVCTYGSGSGLSIYINGTLRANETVSGNIARGAGNEPLFLGSDGGGAANRYLNGTLDEVRIYPTALTKEQVMQRYNETRNGLSSNSTVVSQETAADEVWACQVIPNDSWQDGTPKTSNSLTVGETSRIFADGFESGNFAGWSGTAGSPTVVSSPVHDGSYAMMSDASGEVAYRTGISGYSTVYTRFYVRINALPASGQSVKIAKAMNTTSLAIWELYFQRTSAGLQVRLKSSVPSSLDQTFTYSYAVGTWYCFEVKYSQSATGEYRVWLDGVEILSRTGVNTSGRAFGRLDVGNQWSNYAVTTNIDSIVIDQNYIGPEPSGPTYTLDISVVGTGSTIPSEGEYLYASGTTAPVTANPGLGWALDHWVLDGSPAGSSNPIGVLMNSNHTLTAIFVEDVLPLFADGFESGNFAGWSGTAGSPTVVSSPVHDGSYAMMSDASGEVAYRTGISGYSTVYTRFYVRINALPASGQSVKIAKAMNTTSLAIWELYFVRSGAGALQIRLKSSVPSATDQYYNYDYSADTWYCFEVKYSQSATGEYRVWLDGVEILSRTGVNTSGRAFGRLDVGNQWSNYAVTATIDSVVIDRSYIGPEP